ncbi:MAG: glycerophosphodiester phosphodiesterase family protein [Paracoccaceae bacterium]
MIPKPNVTDPGRVIAHRGASQTAPENTLAAFRAAAAQGAWWAEFDVSLLGDGTPVVHHDATLDRCTSARGPLTGITAVDLPGISAGVRHGPAFAAEPLPTLGEVLDLLEELDFYANLELKPHDGEVGALSAAVIGELSRRAWTQDRIITSSFGLAELSAFRASLPDVPVAVLYDRPPNDWRQVLDELNAAALHLKFTYLTESLLREASSFGIDVRVFTVNKPGLMEPFRDRGLTSVITDHPPLFLDSPEWARWAKS